MRSAELADPTEARLDQLSQLAWSCVEGTRTLLANERAISRCVLADAAAEVREGSRTLSHSRALRARTYYKAVAKVDGRYWSIYDGKTEFRLGERAARQPCHARRGAFFAFVDARQAGRCAFPARSKLLHAPRVVLRVIGDTPVDQAPSAPRACGDGKRQARLTSPDRGAIAPNPRARRSCGLSPRSGSLLRLPHPRRDDHDDEQACRPKTAMRAVVFLAPPCPRELPPTTMDGRAHVPRSSARGHPPAPSEISRARQRGEASPHHRFPLRTDCGGREVLLGAHDHVTRVEHPCAPRGARRRLGARLGGRR